VLAYQVTGGQKKPIDRVTRFQEKKVDEPSKAPPDPDTGVARTLLSERVALLLSWRAVSS
jgi:hypothetical protein